MKKIIIFVAAICLTLVGFSERVLAGPMPISAQEGAQLGVLAANDGLLTLKAGEAFPNAPAAMEAREESALRNLSAGSPNLDQLKAGDDSIGLVTLLVVVLLCLLILKIA